MKINIMVVLIIFFTTSAHAQQFSQSPNKQLTLPPSYGTMDVERVIRWSIPGFEKNPSNNLTQGLRSVKVKKKKTIKNDRGKNSRTFMR